MITGIGTDIIKIQRIRDMYESSFESSDEDSNDPFIKKTYTDKEREEASHRNKPALYYATRFAGKEAVFKSLGIDATGIRLNEIEILDSGTGAPLVSLSGNARKMADEKNIKNIQVSLSYDDEYAVAFAIAQN